MGWPTGWADVDSFSLLHRELDLVNSFEGETENETGASFVRWVSVSQYLKE